MASDLLGTALAEGGQVRLGLGQREARTHSSDDPQVKGAAGPLVEITRHRLPDLQMIRDSGIRRQQQPEGLRHDPDDLGGLIVDQDLLTDHGGVASKAALEQIPGQQDRWRGAGLAVLRTKRTAEDAFGSEHVEEVGGDPSGAKLFGSRIAAPQRHRAARPDAAEGRAGLTAFTQVAKIRTRERGA